MAIVINSTTGEIDLDQTTPGTYVVTYTVEGVSSTQDVTVNAVDNAGFSYSASSYEPTDADPTPTITGLTGGTFSGSTGLVINSTTGEIDLSASTVASHTVTYNTSSSGSSVCPNTSTFDLVITLNQIANNYSMNFDSASSDYIDTGATPLSLNLPATTVTNSNFSLSFWYYFDTNQNYDPIIQATQSATNGFGVWQSSTNTASLNFWVGHYSSGSLNTNQLTSGTWYHIACVFEGGATHTQKIYVDGVLNNSVSYTTSRVIHNSKNCLIGGQTFQARYLDGKLDEFAIWDTVLTDGTGGTVNQIAEIYNATSTNLTKDLTTVSGSNLKYWNRMGD